MSALQPAATHERRMAFGLWTGSVVALAASAASAQSRVLYLSDETGTTTWMVQAGSVIGQFSRQGGLTSAMAVGCDIRTYGAAGQTGHGYDLAGGPNGNTYSNHGPADDGTRDGTTDGLLYNYAVASSGVWRYDRDWQGGQLLFSPGGNRIGIGFDAIDRSLWLADGAAQTVSHYDSTGAPLGQFGIGVAGFNALAFDNKDATIWVASQGNPCVLRQFDRHGNLLGQYSIDVSNGYGTGVVGAEFASPGIWYRDADGDSFGDPDETISACDEPNQPNGYVANGGDCDDTRPYIYPGAPEICDGHDDDCDGLVDENLPFTTWYADWDRDGYGDDGDTIEDCAQPPDYAAQGGDCDNFDPGVYPGAPEVCNGRDDNCDGQADEGLVPATWYIDADGDGYGDSSDSIVACDQPPGYADNASDCDDANPDVYPGAPEWCDGIDQDCNGQVDDGIGDPWFADGDGDGFGDANNSVLACSQPTGYVANADDCDDTDGAAHPGAPETCNGRDDNCDGQVDESGGTAWYADADGDGYGDTANSLVTCDQPNGYIAQAGDCDDSDAAVNPGVIELCKNGIDDNCDGQVDEVCCAESFETAANYAVGTQPYATGAADFDGDGSLDLAVANLYSSSVSILRGRPDGSFQPRADFPLGFSPLSLATGDFNGDRRPDLAVTGLVGTQIYILLNDGAGSFQQPVSYLLGSFLPYGIVVADFNGDATQDLAVALYWNNTLSVLLGNPDGTFRSKVDYSVGGGPLYADAGDFDSDGAIDLVVPNNTAGTVSILMGNGDGTFKQEVEFTVGTGPGDAMAADFDGDGAIDLAVSQAAGIAFLRGNGHGFFDPPVTYPCGGSPSNPVVGDFNGDGRPDLAAGNYDSASVSLLSGNGDGSFEPPAVFPVGSAPLALVSGDFNGDRRLDLAAANRYSNSVSVLLNDGATWYPDADGDGYGVGTVPLVACLQPSGYAAVSGDCDDADASVNPGAPELCNGLDDDCNGQIDEGLSSTWYADADGDSFGDAARVLIACTQPPGYVAAAGDCDDADVSIYPGAMEVCNGRDDDCDGQADDGLTFSMWYLDFDADGYGDAAHGVLTCSQPNGHVADSTDCNDGNASIHPGANEICNGADDNCDGQIDEGVGSAWYADVDADGYGDAGNTTVACSQPSGYAAQAGDCDDADAAVNPGVFEVCGNGIDDNCDGQMDEGCCALSFGAKVDWGVGSQPESVSVGDFNGDGLPDLAVPNEGSNNLSILRNSANGSFQQVGVYSTGKAPGAVAVGDFNGDDRPDLAVVNESSNSVWILQAGADGTFQATNSYATGTDPEAIAAGDFNHDLVLDLAIANFGSGNISVLRGRPDGSFGNASQHAVGTNPHSVAVGDFNRDGRPDLAAANYGSNTVAVLLGRADGSLSPRVPYAMGANPRSVATGDFNGDGWPDLAAAIYGGNAVSVRLGNGDGTFQNKVSYAAGPGPYSVAVGDLDGDAVADLAVANSGGNSVSILAGRRDGTFKGAVLFPTGAGPQTVALGDFNRDGRPDLVSANWSANSVSILLNNGGTWLWYPDADADGYGDSAAVPQRSCARPNGLIAVGGDCDDNDPAAHPGAPEVCDGVDNDCDGQVDEDSDPVITQDPVTQPANLGSTAQFSVADIGGTAWQWRKNGTPILGATNSSYSILSVQESDSGQYSVLVSNGCGQAISANAALIVQPNAPSNLAGAESPKGVVSLTWTDNSGIETAYEVWRATYVIGIGWQTPTLAATLAANSAAYSESPGVGAWRYRVRALNGSLKSAWSAFQAIAPAAPSGLAAQKISAGKAKLTWTDNSDFEAGFYIERQKWGPNGWGNSTMLPASPNTTSYTDSPGAGKYRYRIRASTAAGNSSAYTSWVPVNL